MVCPEGPVGPVDPGPPPPPPPLPLLMEETMREDTDMVLEVNVLPVRVEKVVRENPGTVRVEANMVETLMLWPTRDDVSSVDVLIPFAVRVPLNIVE